MPDFCNLAPVCVCLCLRIVQQQPGTAADGSQVAAGASASFDDVDEEAIWREIHQRQQEEERRQQAGAAEPSLRSQPAAPGLSAVHASPKNTAAALATPEQQPAAGSSGVDVQLLQAAAAGRVPPEPPEGAAGSCRVAFRLPDGSRLQRRFNSTDTVAALQVSGRLTAVASCYTDQMRMLVVVQVLSLFPFSNVIIAFGQKYAVQYCFCCA
jgi:hypothetical protein